MFSFLPLLLSLAGTVQAQDDMALTLHEPKTGATLTLPSDWSLAKDDEALMALSADKSGFVLLAAAEKNFEEIREDVKTLILTRLDEVVVATTTMEGVNERGAIEEIVVASGQGKSRLDGAMVEFAGLLVKSGDGGALVLGAWKDEAHKELVGEILAGLHVKQSAGKGGMVISNAETGASVTIPEGWDVVRNRKGLLAADPNGKAMAILMKWQGDFEKSLETMRAQLLTWVFKEVELGEFAVVEASYHESLGRAVAASGKAVDRLDDMPVEFTALRIQDVTEDQGAVIFGAWKDEKHKEQVAAMMASIEIKKLEEGK